MSGHSLRFSLRGWLLAASLVSCCVLLSAQEHTQPAIPSWQTKYETLQAGVLRIVPQLEVELQTAKTELETSRLEKQKSDAALEKSLADLSASKSDQQLLKDQSIALEQHIEQQQQRINGLVTQLAGVYISWMSSEASRRAMVQGAELLTSRLQEQSRQIVQEQTDQVWIAVVCGIGGAAVGILIYEGVKALAGVR